MNKSIYVFLLLGFISFLGCSTDPAGGDNLSDNPPAEALSYFTLETSIASNHPDANALAVKNTVEYAANDLTFVEFILGAGQIPWENKGDHWEYSFSQGGDTITLKLWPENTAYRLEWHYSGMDDGKAVSGMLLEISQDKDKKGGFMNVFNIYEDPSYKEVLVNWTFNESDDFTGVITTYNPDGSVLDVINIFVKNDGSGDYNVKENGELSEEAQWLVDGSGSLTTYYMSVGTTYNWGPNPAPMVPTANREIPNDIFQVMKLISR